MSFSFSSEFSAYLFIDFLCRGDPGVGINVIFVISRIFFSLVSRILFQLDSPYNSSFEKINKNGQD